MDAAGEARTESEADGLDPFVKIAACAMVAQQQRRRGGRLRIGNAEDSSRWM